MPTVERRVYGEGIYLGAIKAASTRRMMEDTAHEWLLTWRNSEQIQDRTGQEARFFVAEGGPVFFEFGRRR